MSQENVEFAHRIVDAFNDGLDEFMAWHAEDVVHVTAPSWPEKGTYHGKDEVRKLWESIFTEYEEHRIEVDELIALEDDRVLSKLRLYTRGAASGLETTAAVYTLGTYNDEGLISRIEYFLDYDETLEATGLSE